MIAMDAGANGFANDAGFPRDRGKGRMASVPNADTSSPCGEILQSRLETGAAIFSRRLE